MVAVVFEWSWECREQTVNWFCGHIATNCTVHSYPLTFQYSQGRIIADEWSTNTTHAKAHVVHAVLITASKGERMQNGRKWQNVSDCQTVTSFSKHLTLRWESHISQTIPRQDSVLANRICQTLYDFIPKLNCLDCLLTMYVIAINV